MAYLNSASCTDVVGFWNTTHEKSGKAQNIVAIYEYMGKYYGRIVATRDDNGEIMDTLDFPAVRAPGIIGEFYYSGMDIIWNLQKDDFKYEHGKIVDPQQGKIYDSEMWIKGKNLIVRGKILFFGRNQAWTPYEENSQSIFKKPNLKELIPIIPRVK